MGDGVGGLERSVNENVDQITPSRFSSAIQVPTFYDDSIAIDEKREATLNIGVQSKRVRLFVGREFVDSTVIGIVEMPEWGF